MYTKFCASAKSCTKPFNFVEKSKDIIGGFETLKQATGANFSNFIYFDGDEEVKIGKKVVKKHTD